MTNQNHVSRRSSRNFFGISLLFLIPILIFTLFSPIAHSAEVILAWNAVAESDGYKVYHGSNSKAYQSPDDVGTQTDHTLYLDPGTYYFAVTAYNNYGESGYSEEVTCTIAEAAPVTHIVIASAENNGSISPSGEVAVVHGMDQTFSIVPDPNHHVTDVSADGTSLGPMSSYTFSNVIQDHTLVAHFAIDTYLITASAGDNGSITPSDNVTVSHGSSQLFTIDPNHGYHVKDVLVDGESIGPVNSYTFSDITRDHTIHAGFEIDTHIISATAGENGTISPSGPVAVTHGSEQTFSVLSDQNYSVSDLIVDGISVGAQSSYTFTNVTQNHTISVIFAIDTHVIFASAGEGGAINPAGSVSIPHGGSGTFIITPVEDYHVADVVADGVSVGAMTSYTFNNVTGNHAIFAGFERANQPPIASAGPDQSVEEGTIVTLNGSNSIDPDSEDGIISYFWEQTGTQSVVLSDPGAATTTFSAPDVGPDGDALVFRLTVTDSGGLQSSDTCIVNVSSVNIGPTAEAGPNQNANEGDTVTLDGSGSLDPEGEIISYGWEQIAGPHAELSDPTGAQPMFTAPDVGPEGVSLTFQLTVEDNGGLKATDSCIVNVLWVNIPPVADAGPDQTAVSGSMVTLDGSGSNDSDDHIASYRWIQTGGNPVTISDPTAVKPTFTSPPVEQDGDSIIFQLTVRDNGGLEDADTCTVYVENVTTRPPIPDIKANGQDDPITVSYGTRVQITVSLDPGDYAGQKADWWISVQNPNGSWNSYLLWKHSWVRGIRRSLAGSIQDSFLEVLNTKGLTRGVYTFYFAVDDNIDNKPDATWVDAVTVHVQ